ncbi:hypothetical protein SEUCBS139899_006733 [Sporothrix eucalyptigena]
MKTAILTFSVAAWFSGLSIVAASSESSSTPSPRPEQKTWKGATTYPTTITRSWTRTLTPKPTATLSSGQSDKLTIQTVTLYEAWPSSPSPEHFPYTLLQTAVTKKEVYSAQTVDGNVVPTGQPTPTTRTVTSTWMLWDTSPTDLAAGQKLPACDKFYGNSAKCATPNLKQDTRCVERGLTTACHSQCTIRRVEGWDVWLCHKVGDGTSRQKGDDLREVAVGRVCTDSMGFYEQLLEPCDTMDHGHDCPPCNG